VAIHSRWFLSGPAPRNGGIILVLKALITGANGQIGEALARLAPSHNIQGFATNSEILDISDGLRVAQIMRQIEPDIVINAAAYTAVDLAEKEKDRAFAVNCEGPRHLARACAMQNIPLLHISTDYIFSGNGTSPFRETDDPSPQNVYGETKLAGERAIRAVLPHHIILRTAWVYSLTGKNFLKTMLRLGFEKEALSVVDDQHGTPSFADDIAEALLTIANKLSASDKPAYGTYHYTGNGRTTWHGFAKEVFDVVLQETGKEITLTPTTSDAFPTPARRPAWSVLNCEKIEKNFAITPKNWQQRVRYITKALLERNANTKKGIS
jgi:dTDP-4-dehydrorhamnose reductase